MYSFCYLVTSLVACLQPYIYVIIHTLPTVVNVSLLWLQLLAHLVELAIIYISTLVLRIMRG